MQTPAFPNPPKPNPWPRRLSLALALPLAAILAAIGAFCLLDQLYPFPTERLADALGNHSLRIFARDHSLLSWQVDEEENWRLPVQLKNVSPWLSKATQAVEDKRFQHHPGIDVVAIARAMGQNLFHLRRISGASTLSMQTVRLLWQRPRRLSSKLVEAFRAVQLERLVGKEGILELYFNLAPYGGNIVGAEAASRRYFGKSAASLTLGEAALLAGIPQSPSRLAPRKNGDLALQRRRHVLARMLALRFITPGELEAAEREKLELEKPQGNLAAGHFPELVRRVAAGNSGSVETTLDPAWQERTTAAVAKHGAEWSGKGVGGPAVVVLSLKDSSVLAYIGNSLEQSVPGQMVDGVRAKRQPGSLLKPFIFASLADQGRITPTSRVYDLPAFWEGYAPENIDRKWRGEMSAGDALRQSRNLPAVKQLQALGLDHFTRLMARLGLDPGQSGRDGLALALGSREQNLLSLANAYAALGRLGWWLPVRVVQGEAPAGEGKRVWSEEAAWLTLSALSPAEESAAPAIAWKTGTSWNQRDAWAVVLTPEAVVGVWCGRQSGGGSSWVIGAEDALPVALDIAEALGLGRGGVWLPPAGIEFREVCAASGELPGWNCPETLRAPMRRANTGERRCERHRGAEAGKHPSETVSGKAAPAPVATGHAKRLRLLSPQVGACYLLDGDGGNELQLAAENGGGGGKLFWFVDGTLYRVSRPNEKLPWKMSVGVHTILVVDEKEGSDRVTFSVLGME